jgi:hypothetical protein
LTPWLVAEDEDASDDNDANDADDADDADDMREIGDPASESGFPNDPFGSSGNTKQVVLEDPNGSSNVVPSILQPLNVAKRGPEEKQASNTDKSTRASPPPPPSPPTEKVDDTQSPSFRKGKRKTPPAVQVFRSKAHRYPAKAWFQKIHKTVGQADDDLEFWGQVVFAWVGMGWNPTNVRGMLDFYQRREIPGEDYGKRKTDRSTIARTSANATRDHNTPTPEELERDRALYREHLRRKREPKPVSA